jgi:hypothetical protein
VIIAPDEAASTSRLFVIENVCFHGPVFFTLNLALNVGGFELKTSENDAFRISLGLL